MSTVAESKAALRLRIRAARTARPLAERQEAAARIATSLGELARKPPQLRNPAGWDQPALTAAYLPLPSEPLNVEEVLALSRHTKLVVPASAVRPELSWIELSPTSPLTTGRFGIPVAQGAELAPETLGRCGLIVVPALALDGRGHRLGQGGGFYDRSLPYADAAAVVVATVFDDEILAEIPSAEHDFTVDIAVTPSRVRALTDRGRGYLGDTGTGPQI